MGALSFYNFEIDLCFLRVLPFLVGFYDGVGAGQQDMAFFFFLFVFSMLL